MTKTNTEEWNERTAWQGMPMKTVLHWVCRLVLAGVFAYAGIAKMADPAAFAASIATFEILPAEWSNLVALVLPPFEVLAGLVILAPFGVRTGALSLGTLSAVFLVALLSALVRGIPVDCGCFGASGPSSVAQIWLAVGRDVGLGAVALFLYATRDRWTTS